MPSMTVMKSANGVQGLYTSYRDARIPHGGLPQFGDIVANLDNAEKYDRDEINLSRSRIRLGKTVSDPHGNVIAYIGFTLVVCARPTQYERKYIWVDRPDIFINGVYGHHLIVHPSHRGQGHARELLYHAIRLGRKHDKNFYCDVPDDNILMHKCAIKNGGVADKFWQTPSKTRMVRYLWHWQQKNPAP